MRSPPNPPALLPGQTGPPVVCAFWDPRIDHTTFVPGAAVDVLLFAAGPANVLA